MDIVKDNVMLVYNCTGLWRGIVAGAMGLYLLKKAMAKIFSTIYRRVVAKNFPLVEHKDGIVYLHSFPRSITRQMVNLSPFSIKLETWMRLKKIKYEFVDSLKFSEATSQMPYIVYNGEQHAESNLIVQELNRIFDLDPTDGLTPEQLSITLAFTKVAEDSLALTQFICRYVYKWEEFKKIMTFHFLPKFGRHRINMFLRLSMLEKGKKNGMARLGEKQVIEIGKDDIRAISNYLSDKKFMHGDEMTLLDCTLYGQLSQIVLNDFPFPHKEILKTECPNILPYVERIRDRLWPDWYNLVHQELFEP